MNRGAPVATTPVHRLTPLTGRSLALWVFAITLPLMPIGAAHGVSSGANLEGRTNARVPATLPRFSSIPGWEDLIRSDLPPRGHQNDTSVPSQPPEHAADMALTDLCRFYGLSFSPASIWTANRSPLEWPPLLRQPKTNARRQRIEIASLLSANRLVSRELTALEPAQIADSIKAAIAGGTPAVLNAPGVPVVYGYDHREPDPWWWVSSGGETLLILESERLARFVYWDDDPAASVLWVVSGVDSAGMKTAEHLSGDYEFLRHISVSARGDPGNGVAPYPLSLRDLRDRLAESQSPLFPNDAGAPSDPYGIRRAGAARGHLLAALGRMTQAERDTNLSAPLRIAQYCGHNALAVLRQLEDSLYHDPIGVAPDRLPIGHIDPKRRLAAAGMFTDLLRWEKQMVEQIDRALLAYDAGKTPPPKPIPPKKPGRRRH